MAKATVTQNLGSGKYRIKIKKDLRGVSDKIDELTSKLAELEESIETKKTALELAEQDLKTAQDQAEAIGINYDIESDDSQYRSDYIDAQSRVTAYGKAVGNLKEELRQLYANKLNASQNLESLQAIEAEKEIYCIAADKSDSIPAGAEVSAIEHARDGNTTAYTIRPAFDAQQDSVVVPGKRMSAWSHLYAQLAQPAVLTQKPKYWFGVIRSIGDNGLLADVDIYDRVIRSVSLSPKNSSMHTCDCDFLGSADFLGRFSAGDRVVVDFHFGVGTPTVIGFAVDPGLDFSDEPYKPEPLPRIVDYELVDTFTLYLRYGYYIDYSSGFVLPMWTENEDSWQDQSFWRLTEDSSQFVPGFHKCRMFTKHRLVTSTHESCTEPYYYSQSGIGVDELNHYVRSYGYPIDFLALKVSSYGFLGRVVTYTHPVTGAYKTYVRYRSLSGHINKFLGDAHSFTESDNQYGLVQYHFNRTLRFHKYFQSKTPVSSYRQKYSRSSDEPFYQIMSGKIFGAEKGFVRMRNLASGAYEDVSKYSDCVIEFDGSKEGFESTSDWNSAELAYVGKILKPIYE